MCSSVVLQPFGASTHHISHRESRGKCLSLQKPNSYRTFTWLRTFIRRVRWVLCLAPPIPRETVDEAFQLLMRNTILASRHRPGDLQTLRRFRGLVLLQVEGCKVKGAGQALACTRAGAIADQACSREGTLPESWNATLFQEDIAKHKFSSMGRWLVVSIKGLNHPK